MDVVPVILPEYAKLNNFLQIMTEVQHLPEKTSNKPANKSIEIIPLSNKEVRLIQKETTDSGKTVVTDEKYKITESYALAASRESIASEIIRTERGLLYLVLTHMDLTVITTVLAVKVKNEFVLIDVGKFY